MTDSIKFPPMPLAACSYGMSGEYTRSQMLAYAREAVRLNATVPCDCTTEIHADGTRKTWCGSVQMRMATEEGHAFAAAPAAPRPALAPRKIEIPPPGADALDVAFAEGWNQCCDAYFGGLPPQAPLVVTVFKTNSDTAAPQPAQPLTDEQAASLAKQLGWDTMPERFPLIVRAVEQALRNRSQT